MKKRFMSWHVLLLQYLKRDWKKITIWVVVLGAFCGGFVVPFEEIGQGQGLIGMYETMRNPAMISMVGPTPITNANDYTIGAMYAQEMLIFCALFAMVITALHVISHTRKEEDSGLNEIIRSFKIGRQANSLAIIIEIIIINILLMLVMACLMSVVNVSSIDVNGSFVFAGAIALAGLMGGLFALFFAQIMSTSAGATSATIGLIGILYVIRAGTDVSNLDLSMFNPLGWLYLCYPFVENKLFPLVVALVFCFILLIISFILEEKRDLGVGYLPQFEGHAHARKNLLSIRGITLRINRTSIVVWLLTFMLLGAAYGSIYGDMQNFLESNDLMKQMFTQAGYSIEESFTATIMMVMGGLSAILPIVIINKLFSSETKLYLSQTLSTKVSRFTLYVTTLVVAIVMGILALIFGALGLGASALAVMSNSTISLQEFILISLNYIPAVLFFIGIASLALGWAPRLIKIAYAYLGYSFVLSYFGNILDLPEWFNKTSVLDWLPRLPIAQFDVIAFILLTIISIIMITIGYFGYKKRDLEM